MGIPGYFSYVARRYPGIVVDSGILDDDVFSDGIAVNGADAFYIDFNNLVHNCARYAVAGKSYATDDEMFSDVVSAVCEYTSRLVEIANPRKLVYIAADGVPPVAKMAQQRKRRMMTMAENRFKKQSPAWRPTFVTPGTAFMRRLNESLPALCAALGRAGALEVMVSSWDRPGEGEHKIFEHLSGQPPGVKALIYGMDADMLMLSLLHESHRLVVMRQRTDLDADMSVPSMPHFQFVVVDNLRRALAKEMRCSPDEASVNYVCMCCLIGNDFLPPLAYLSVEAVPMLINLTSELHGRLAERAPGEDGCFVRFRVLRALMALLAHNEDRRTITADERYWRTRAPQRPSGMSAKDHAWTYLPLFDRPADVVRPKEPGWRLRRSRQLLGDVANTASAVEAYLEGIEWTMRYYLAHSSAGNAWYYPFNYSPTVLDLQNRLVGRACLGRGWEAKHALDFEVTPELQMLAVLPVSERSLVRKGLRALMTDPAHGCAHMFPSGFEIATYGKGRVWECCPIVPPMDLRALAAAAASTTQSKETKTS
jgi:5'-3' exonuclease